MLEIVRVGSGAPELWLVAGVHGDETEGIACVEDALASLRPRRGTLVGVPVAHPAALARGTRRGVDDADLNRIYPGSADGGPTERAAHALWSALRGHADLLVTFHSWHRSGAAAPYVEYDPDDAHAAELAHALGLPFAEPLAWPDGLLPKVATAAGIPAVELELGGLGAQTAESLAIGVRAARAAAASLGMVDPERLPATETVRRHVLRAGAAGRVRQRAALGAPVAAGAPVCELRGLDGGVRETLRSPVDGWVAVHQTHGWAERGAAAAIVFERAA